MVQAVVDFAKRSEVTVQTMGKVHNPSGEGVRAISSQAQSKAQKIQQAKQQQQEAAEEPPISEISVKDEAGSSRRNILRKKSGANEGCYDSRNKKQGGHGKGQWNSLIVDYDLLQDSEPLDEKDPLFDETQDAQYILSSTTQTKQTDEKYQHETTTLYGPMLTLTEFKIRLAETLKEYFDSADSEEVIQSLQELQCQEYSSALVKKAISLSLDETPRERELVSRLFTQVHPSPLSTEQMEVGFDVLLDDLDDLEIDIPDAKTMVASFLARAVVDEVVPPAYLSKCNNDRPGNIVVEKAVSLLTREHSTARLERIWGPGDGRFVEELKQDVDQLLEEYLHSRELDEAARCVRELNAPQFHHELVKRGIKLSLEKTEDQMDAMVALFDFLIDTQIVSDSQVKKGFERGSQILEDWTLDVPAAPKLFGSMVDMALKRNVLKEFVL